MVYFDLLGTFIAFQHLNFHRPLGGFCSILFSATSSKSLNRGAAREPEQKRQLANSMEEAGSSQVEAESLNRATQRGRLFNRTQLPAMGTDPDLSSQGCRSYQHSLSGRLSVPGSDPEVVTRPVLLTLQLAG